MSLQAWLITHAPAQFSIGFCRQRKNNLAILFCGFLGLPSDFGCDDEQM